MTIGGKRNTSRKKDLAYQVQCTRGLGNGKGNSQRQIIHSHSYAKLFLLTVFQRPVHVSTKEILCYHGKNNERIWQCCGTGIEPWHHSAAQSQTLYAAPSTPVPNVTKPVMIRIPRVIGQREGERRGDGVERGWYRGGRFVWSLCGGLENTCTGEFESDSRTRLIQPYRFGSMEIYIVTPEKCDD